MSFDNELFDIATQYNLNPDLVRAIVDVESSGKQYKVRYEPGWRYPYKVDDFAKSLLITSDTERVLQSCSWGLMQIMGSVARELGFAKDLPLLCDCKTNLFYGCKKLKSLMNRYDLETDAISAYNAGSPKLMANGKYFNQQYVDKVTKRLEEIRRKKSD